MTNKREMISNKIQETFQGIFPDEFYCDKCTLLIVNTKTAELIEELLGGYCDICECPDE